MTLMAATALSFMVDSEGRAHCLYVNAQVFEWYYSEVLMSPSIIMTSLAETVSLPLPKNTLYSLGVFASLRSAYYNRLFGCPLVRTYQH